jgi:hypothetical protein
MKPRSSHQTNHALTLVEVLVVIVGIAIFASVGVLFLSVIAARNHGAPRINCISNLKQIGLAYRIWEGDHAGKFPTQVLGTNAGVATIFQTISNELSTPKLLICPADKNSYYATNFSAEFSNKNVSYFVGLDADTNHSQAFLSGDDNFAIDDISVKSGLLTLFTNDPISWTASRHHLAGNIGLADGSVCEVNTHGLTNYLLQQTGLATNRLAIP